MTHSQIDTRSLFAGSAVTAGLVLLTSMQGGYGPGIHGDVREFLSHVSMVDLPDGQGGLNRTVRITGINVQVVNGLDATNGYPPWPDSIDPLDTQTNGTGNIIVGYNELGNPFGDDRTGSHNLVFGHGNSYSSFGGLVGPLDNTISGPFASVSGGRVNTASGFCSSISGGNGNTASGGVSSVSGGASNTACGGSSSISGGNGNTASGSRSSVTGGHVNTASSHASSVSGGRANVASSIYSSVSGGDLNTASGSYSSVSGGFRNTASGWRASISGGNTRTALGIDDWVAGSLFEDN